jgi:hypothetical protein
MAVMLLSLAQASRRTRPFGERQELALETRVEQTFRRG